MDRKGIEKEGFRDGKVKLNPPGERSKHCRKALINNAIGRWLPIGP